MNKLLLYSILSEQLYLSDDSITKIMHDLGERSRAFVYTKDACIKVCIPKEEKFYKSLQNSVRIYDNYSYFPVNIPELYFSFFEPNERICIISTQRIEGEALGTKRNCFSVLPGVDINSVISDIGEIKKFDITENWLYQFDRKTKIKEYADKVFNIIGRDLADKVEEIQECLINNSSHIFSHGDLIPSNIIRDFNNRLWFIDWEWAANRTKYFDETLFVLFSDLPTEGLTKIEKIAKNQEMLCEMYFDCILISLREIKNWMNVADAPTKKRYTEIWKIVLEKTIINLKELS